MSGGEMGALFRAHDWASTPLGPAENWPLSLRAAVDLILCTPVAMTVSWGPDGVYFYNDAFISIAGPRHPGILGRTLRDAWPEAAELSARALRLALSGESLSLRDQPLTVFRNGEPEPATFDFDCSPLFDENGTAAGLLSIIRNTTEANRAQAALREAEERLGEALAAGGMAAWHWNPETDQMIASGSMNDLLGLLPGESFGSGAQGFHLVHPEDREAHRATMGAAARKAGNWQREFRIIRPRDGRIAWLEERTYTKRDRTGKLHVTGLVWDITDRKSAEEALRDNEERYRTLFNSIDEGFCIIDVLFDANGNAHDYRFLEANPAFERQTGLVGAIGKTIRELAPNHDPHWLQTYGRIALTGVPERFEDRAEALGYFYDVYAFRIGAPELRRVAALFRDVLERKRREANLAFLAEISKDLTRPGSTDDIMQAVGAKIGAYLKVDTCNFCDIDDPRDELIISYGWHNADMPNLHGTYRISEYVSAKFKQASRAGEIITIRDTRTDPRTHARSCAALEIRSFLAVPFRVRGEWKYTLSVADSRSRDWQQHEIELFQELASRIFPRIERARAEEALRQSEARQAFLLKLSDALRPLADPVEIQFEATRALGERLAAGRVGYAECEGGGDTVVVNRHYTSGVPGIEGRHHLDDYGAALLSDLLSGRVVVHGDIPNDPGFTDAEKAKYAALPLGAMVDIPLVKAGRLVAVLFIHYREAHAFSAGELSLMEAVAERTWAAVERARAEAALRESEEKYRSLFESMDEGFALCEIVRDAQGRAVDVRYLDLNPAFEKQTGLRREGSLGRLVSKALPGLDDWWLAAFAHVVEANEPVRFERRVEPLDRWYDIRAFPRGGDRFAFLYDNITDRKRVEEALRENEARQAFLVRLTDALRPLADPLTIQEAAARLLGEHLNANRVHYCEIVDNVVHIQRDYATGVPSLTGSYPFEIWGRKLMEAYYRGENLAINDVHGHPMFAGEDVSAYDAAQITSGIMISLPKGTSGGAVLGITSPVPRVWREAEVRLAEEVAERTWAAIEQARAQAALHASEARERARAAELEAILDAAPVAMFIAQDPESRYMVGSRMTYEMLRLPPRSNVSKSAPDAQQPVTFRSTRDGREIPIHDLPVQKAAATGQAVRNYEFDIVYEDSTSRNMLGDAVPLFDEQGRPRGSVGAFVDITERKRTEERLRQAQKLESVGLLAGGIAHDFNNLLTGIMGNASMVLDEVSADVAERIREVMSSAERAANLTRQLLAYSGKGQFVVRDVNVSEAVNEISSLVEFSIPKSVSLSVTVQRRLPVVCMDPSQLQQILMNLVINAGEAIGDGNLGEITVATSMTDIHEAFVDATGEEVAPGRYVCIDVSDTGSGIDQEKKSKIFDPFFTTKFTGRGLGLSAVAGIVRSQKGGITVESAAQRGATFRVFLPVAEKHAPERGSPGADQRGTILVVDDESTVRDFIGAVLRRRGYRVLTASDGREALAICDRERGNVDAIVLDVVMPVMGANDLLPKIKDLQPNVKVLLTSGYSESEARRLCAAYPGASFIQKPYTAQQIAKAVEELRGADRR